MLWFISSKKKNKLMHSINGNSTNHRSYTDHFVRFDGTNQQHKKIGKSTAKFILCFYVEWY